MAEFIRRGYRLVEGVDFAPTKESARSGVRKADCRTWRSKNKFNLILCLYDVIGSFSDNASNEAIVRNIVRHLAPGGHAVLSVSNVRFRKTAALPLLDGKDRSKFLRSIFRLRPSKVMYLVVDRRYTSGEIQKMLCAAGLKVVLRRFVRSGFKEGLSEMAGKEILVIARAVCDCGEVPKN